MHVWRAEFAFQAWKKVSVRSAIGQRLPIVGPESRLEMAKKRNPKIKQVRKRFRHQDAQARRKAKRAGKRGTRH